MYEMRAEQDPASDESVLVWHIVSKETPTTLCGRAQLLLLVAADEGDQGGQRFCPPCLTAFEQVMTAAR
ncbi:hypothetical protein ABIA33_002794 [Streptacidiphilus sp. MAP12-16]|uniref:hypothetical protein n=1 Tax=Streptacidiphilus sp. MAP12-16 TaxID=3156300 RepID=UPI0035173C8C